MDPFVSPDWLLSRLASPGVTLLDATLPPVGVLPRVDTRARYEEQHLPGALFFDLEELSDHRSGLPHMLPLAEAFAAAMGQMGVRDDSVLVVYEQGDVFSAPRAWWTLGTLGARQVYLLDGGLRAWVEAGYPTESGPVVRSSAEFTARLRPKAVETFAGIQRCIADRRQGAGAAILPQILDARSRGRFEGTAPEPRPGLRSGHMPGALSVPYTELIDGPRLRPAEELRAVFARHSVNLGQPAITTCGSGVTAAVIALALQVCGAPEPRLFDGSWAEYAAHPEAVTAVGPEGASDREGSRPAAKD